MLVGRASLLGTKFLSACCLHGLQSSSLPNVWLTPLLEKLEQLWHNTQLTFCSRLVTQSRSRESKEWLGQLCSNKQGNWCWCLKVFLIPAVKSASRKCCPCFVLSPSPDKHLKTRREREAGGVFCCLVASNCCSNKAQDYQHIWGKIHKVPFSSTPGIWCEDVICFLGLPYLVAFFFPPSHLL